VGLNSDAWLERKKGKAFMSWHERMTILDNLHMVDSVIDFDDTDGTAIDADVKLKKCIQIKLSLLTVAYRIVQYFENGIF